MKNMRKKISPFIFLLTIAVTTASNAYGQSTKETNFDWLKHAHIFIIDGYYYPLCPKLEFNAEKLAETMVDMHANVLRIATSGHCGWMIPGTQFVSSPDLGNRDILAECIAACKPLGIKVVPYINTSHTQKTSQIQTDWAQKLTPAGNYASTWSMGEKVTPICFNSSYRQAFYNLVRTVVSKYDIDGIYFDTWVPFHFFRGEEAICYCEGCQKGFKEATGMDIPYKENADEYSSAELKIIDLYRKWCREELFKVFSETKRIVKSYKDIPLIYNIGNPTTIMNEDFRILEGSDAFLYERGRSMIERAEGVSLATAHGLAVWPYVGTYDPSPRIPHLKYELGQEIFTSVAFGGSPILYHTYFFTEHPESRGIIKEAFRILDENDMYIKGFSSDKFCAVIWNNTDPPGHAVESWLWNTNARLNSLGSFSSCIHDHIQTTSMLKQDLDNIDILNKYKVLFLPDICYLTDKQIANITKFVENGGGLVMTYATSLYDENGEKRSDFALGNLARIKYHPPDYQMSEKISKNLTFGSGYDLYLKTRTGQQVINSPIADGLIPAHLYETVDVLPGGTIAADMVAGTDNEPLVPGLVVSRYGKGKVAYISAATGAMFQQTGMMEYADFLKNVIEYVSADRVPYEIEAPQSTLITNMTVNGDKRVFHLITWTGSQNENMWQNVYYIPPIENVTINFRIPDGKKIKKISSFVPVKIKHKMDKDILHINIPRIEKYQGIVIELE
jgi:hypothetical protein